MQNIKKTFFQTLNWFKEMLPMLLGILLIVAMLKQSWFFDILTKYFWSISAGTTINSYIIADSFWKIDNYILVITAFLVSWITVWIIQIPAEIYFFGKKFALTRNLISFIFSIIISYIVYFLYFL